MPLKIVNDTEEVIVWSPVPMAYYIVIPIRGKAERNDYSVEYNYVDDNALLDGFINYNNNKWVNRKKAYPNIFIIKNVTIYPSSKKVHIFWSYSSAFTHSLIHSFSEHFTNIGVKNNKQLLLVFRSYFKALLDASQNIKPNYGASRLRNPFS